MATNKTTAAARGERLAAVAKRLDALQKINPSDDSRTITIAVEFDPEGGVFLKFKPPHGLGLYEGEYNIGSSESHIKQLEEATTRFENRCKVADLARKCAADAWASLTETQRMALVEYPPAEMQSEWNSSNC